MEVNLLLGFVGVQIYFLILAIDIKIKRPSVKRLAKVGVVLAVGTLWGISLKLLNPSAGLGLGMLLGGFVATRVMPYLPWKSSQLLPYSLTTKHFHVYTDLAPDPARFYATFFEEFTAYFQTHFFNFSQNDLLNVYLFRTSLRYEFYNRKYQGFHTPYGYYHPKKNLVVVNLSSGLGTATHELVHHFIAQGFTQAACPEWIGEGLAMFFEKFIAHFDPDGRLVISVGYFSNWRFPQTKRMIDKVTFQDLVRYKHPSPVRDFILFLHRKGLLKKFIEQLQARHNDPDGIRTLEAVSGQKIPALVEAWKAWVRAQPIDGNVRLIGQSFVKEHSDWLAWLRARSGRLVWDSTLEIYRVEKSPAQERRINEFT